MKFWTLEWGSGQVVLCTPEEELARAILAIMSWASDSYPQIASYETCQCGRDPNAEPEVAPVYGQAITGRAFVGVVIVPIPETDEELRWLRDHLIPRLAPGASIEFRPRQVLQ